ncbi:chemotaxis protein CheW [Rheinheimera sp. 4Y26]|uniref:chemotaxis protein CheW n=1 Tax=Rheinheimera sp. 4Y26 TaxID=2977811 RepID=UPI0021B13DA3|nr:chemotaxis protein CheW [Rheinheimera sp. 4Y26]MCT6700605.1 chemotaxis protein CheW [Rheinheimera sp. 4Y26]
MSDLVASHKVMRNYLAALLTEEQEPEVQTKVAEVKKQQLNQLLATVQPDKPKAAAVPAATAAPKIEAKVQPEIVKPAPAATANKVVVPEVVVKAVPPAAPAMPVVEKTYRQGRFQALFFEVAGLKVALPLKDLGGIHKITAINTLPGKPLWYKGVMLYREQKINVVDTARWVMPEKYDQQLAESLNYQYVIMLGKSSWGIACESLINTVALEQEDVKWREAQGKRPWLAGLIKQHMCALLDVDALIALLAQGAGSSD